MPFFAALAGLLGGAAKAAIPSLLSSVSARASAPQTLDMNTMRGFQQPTQDLVNRQLGMSEDMMDPQSDLNLNMKRMMAQRASETGAQTAGAAAKMAAMRGVSQGQAQMQQKMGMNQAMGGVNQQWLQNLMKMRGAGMGMMSNMTQMTQGLGDNMANIHMANQNLMNKNPLSGPMGGQLMGSNMLQGLLGQWMGSGQTATSPTTGTGVQT